MIKCQRLYLRMLFHVFFQFLVIVNHSLLTSVFLLAWRKSEVVPLLKEGDHEIANSNRPVSLLPVASKVCERVALNHNNRRLTEHQSGNKKLHMRNTKRYDDGQGTRSNGLEKIDPCGPTGFVKSL